MCRIVNALALFLLVAVVCGCKPAQAVVLPFGELVARPDRYHGTLVCTEGVYVSGFEASALGATLQRDGVVYRLAEPNIWLEGADIVSSDGCFGAGTGSAYVFCRVRACGWFEGKGGYGHGGACPFQIRNGSEKDDAGVGVYQALLVSCEPGQVAGCGFRLLTNADSVPKSDATGCGV